jgi:hypothetical protein
MFTGSPAEFIPVKTGPGTTSGPVKTFEDWYDFARLYGFFARIEDRFDEHAKARGAELHALI